MSKALFRFYEELNDRLLPCQRKKDFEVPLEGKKTAREIIENLGVPPAQVDLLLVNGDSVSLDYLVEEGDRLSVYPVFERLNVKGVSRVREVPLRKLRFIVDKDLGAVGESLKTLGLDICFRGDLGSEQTLRVAKEERRILITTERDFPGSEGLDRMILLKPASLQEQVTQVLRALDLGKKGAWGRGHESERERPF